MDILCSVAQNTSLVLLTFRIVAVNISIKVLDTHSGWSCFPRTRSSCMSLISLRSSVTCTPLGLHGSQNDYINLHIDPLGGGRMIRRESSFKFQSAISPTHGHKAASGPSHEHSLRSPRHCRLEFHPKMQDPLGTQTKPWQLCDFQEAQNIRMLRPKCLSEAFVQLFPPSWSRNMMKIDEIVKKCQGAY